MIGRTDAQTADHAFIDGDDGNETLTAIQDIPLRPIFIFDALPLPFEHHVRFEVRRHPLAQHEPPERPAREGGGEAPPARLRHREEPRRRRRRLLVEDDQAAVRGEGTGAEVG